MSGNEYVVSGRAWAVEAAMGHCVLWAEASTANPPVGAYNGKEYAQELVDLLTWGVEQGINGIGILHGERGGYADPGGLRLEQTAQHLGVPFAVGGHVGHGFPHWMPAHLFEQQPELFRIDPSGDRTISGNLCVSNRESLGRAAGELTLLVDRHPGVRLIQAWAEDVHGGSWCNCPRCRDLSPAEQYAAVISTAAGAVSARRPGTQTGFLLYHDTLTGLPRQAISEDGIRFLPPTVYASYAPRERCYAHAINDPSCQRNRLYWQALLHAVEVFEGRVDVFEYYGDTILWQYLNVAIPHVIAEDLRAYASLGVREVQALMFGTYSMWAHGLNLATFAWLSSGQETSADAAVARYARERFGPDAEATMVRYYDRLERAQAGYLNFCGYEDEWMHDLRGFHRPSPWYTEHRRRLAQAKEEYGDPDALLKAAEGACRGDQYLANLRAEQAHLAITRIELEELDMRLALGERATVGGSARPTEDEQHQRSLARQRQWDLAQSVPVEIRGQAFGALAVLG